MQSRLLPEFGASTRLPRKSSAKDEGTVTVGSPNVPGYRSKVNAVKYRAMKSALLKVFPRKEPGITQNEMMERVAPLAPRALFPARTYMWWAKCVQLDLESKHELVRDKEAKPLRWRRAD